MGSIRIRPIERADRADLQRFYAELSPDSRRARFHGCGRGIAEPLAGFFCGPDHEHREGLAAVRTGAPGTSPRIVGHLCLDPSGDGEMEMAVAVADAWQRQGIGRALLAAAIEWARPHGIGRLRASILCSNAEMSALLRSSGCPVTQSTSAAGVVEATLDIRPALTGAA
jgi:acetyltransferase